MFVPACENRRESLRPSTRDDDIVLTAEFAWKIAKFTLSLPVLNCASFNFWWWR
jgi:hypothetical protein